MAKCPIPVTLGDVGFSVRVYCLSCKAPILASGTRISPLHDLAVTYTLPGGSDKDTDASDLAGIHGIFSGFASAIPTASEAPRRPPTAPWPSSCLHPF